MGGNRSNRLKAEYEAQNKYDRAKWPRCGKIVKASGKQCGRVAGGGTDHFGEGPCHLHEKAEDMRSPLKKVQHNTFSMSRPIGTTPAKALQFILDVTFGQLVYAYWKVSLLDESEYWVNPKSGGPPHLNMHIKHLSHLKDETVRYAKAAGDLGIAERMTALAEQQAHLISDFVQAVVGDLKLTEQQQEALGPSIRAHTKMLVQQNATPAMNEVLSQEGTLTVSG